MTGVIVTLEGLVVLAAIFLGVRMGGIGLGLWGVLGTGGIDLHLRDGPRFTPVDAFFIIIAVITASAAMQAAGGIDFLVTVASKIIRRNPRHITYVAPLVAFVFTVGAGTSNIYFALIPVIYETAYRNGIRPERPLAAATVCSALGITASPVSSAMAAYLTLLPGPFSLPKILAFTIPASIVACLLTSLVQQRIGKELVDDPELQRRVAAGEVAIPTVLVAAGATTSTTAPRSRAVAAVTEARTEARTGPGDIAIADHPIDVTLPPGSARSAYVFLTGVVLIVAMGLFEGLRPIVGTGAKAAPLGMTQVIEIVMFSVALVILLLGRIQPALVLRQPLLSAGLVAAIALFGIA